MWVCGAHVRLFDVTKISVGGVVEYMSESLCIIVILPGS